MNHYNNYLKTTLFFFLLSLGLNQHIQAQQVDFNQVVPDEETRPKTFEEYLVQLAWKNNPQPQILSNQKEIANYEVMLSKGEWMNNLTAQFSLNEVSLSNLIYNYEDPLFVAQPLWNLSAQINLGTIFNRPKEIKIAKEKLKITEQNINLLKLNLRALVLKRYEEYLLSIEILRARTEADEEAYQNYQLMGDLFKADKANFEELTQASATYINAREAKIQATADIKLTRLLLEELIGVSLEEAERFGAAYKKEEEE